MTGRRDDTILHIILLVSDLVGTVLGVILAFLLRYHTFIGISKPFDMLWLLALILLVAAFTSVFISPIHKYISRGAFAEFLDVVKRQLVSVIIVIVILYLAHNADVLSRLVFLYFVAGSILFIWIMRLCVKSYLINVYRKNKEATRIVIITDSERQKRVEKTFKEHNDWRIVLTNCICVNDNNYQEALDYIVHNEVDEIFVSIDTKDGFDDYKRFISDSVGMGIKVDIDINQFELDVPGRKYLDNIANHAVVSISRNQMTISQTFVKRVMDIIGSMLGMIVFLLAFIIIGPIIKLDSKGPIIFVQKRVGKNGRIFDFYKFRSMYIDAEERKKELLDKNEVEGLMFKLENDPRITKVGKFIRKTSIDELPQFWNVLKGDMSLVGTRPPTVDEYERYESWHKSRLSMKPGITGLWQISGRSDIKDFNEVVKLDMQYIDNWSLTEDIKILLKTVGAVFTGKGSK